MRYIVGIDLGTTNCALAFVDTEQPSLALQPFAIPQLTSPGKVDALSTLPSFCYLVDSGEWSPGALKLPWKEETESFVGQWAKLHGARVPTKLVQSAKSWLCNVAANRRDKILPVEAANLSQRLSPVEASAHYLMHLKEAWNALMTKGNPAWELEEQEVILTVPASFDEVARKLTLEAARLAGLLHVTLLEEPQAAFYSWISQHEQEWQARFKTGEKILVCDVGGGTTDFSLIEIHEQEGKLSFQRMAVGDHLLLGGDNMDAALAHDLEKKLGSTLLESTQWLQLLAEARTVKEEIFMPGNENREKYSVTMQGQGSSVVKGSVGVDVSRSEVERLLLNGFFGRYSLSDALQLKQSRGFRTMGLPFEDEPSITKHLAYFLKQAKVIDAAKGIDYILFNGGTLKPEIFQKALELNLTDWFPQTTLKRLSSVSLDLAVARGAAYYGKVRRGLGVVIGGGLSRTYYLKIDVKDAMGVIKPQALTLLPRGSQEGKEVHSDHLFSLRPNVPVSFHLLTSHVRLEDRVGDLVDIDPLAMQILPPIETILRFGKKASSEMSLSMLPVKLGIRMTAIGTVDLWLESQSSEHRWSLEFQLRSATGQEPLIQQAHTSGDETFEIGDLDVAKQAVHDLFQSGSTIKLAKIMEHLEGLIGKDRRSWGPTVLRELWKSLLSVAEFRKKSSDHESRWWNLAGFLLRPGYGVALDDFRMKELWKIILTDLKMTKPTECLIQLWICYRRLSGGLSKGQQMQIASELASDLFDKKTRKIEVKRKEGIYSYSEKIRALASFERLELPLKIRIGEALVERIVKDSPGTYDYWALGRIGARHLLYGSVVQVIPRDTCAQWIEALLKHHPSPENEEAVIFLLKQLARKTDHRELNLPEAILKKIMAAYPHEHLKDWLLEEKAMTPSEQEQAFGDSLPAGLILELKKS